MKVISTIQEFEEMIKQNPAVLVDFFAEWCGPCKMINPLLEEFSNNTPGVEIIKVDVDQLPNLAQQFEIMSIPALCTFKNGELKQKSIGFQVKEKIEKMIQEII